MLSPLKVTNFDFSAYRQNIEGCRVLSTPIYFLNYTYLLSYLLLSTSQFTSIYFLPISYLLYLLYYLLLSTILSTSIYSPILSTPIYSPIYFYLL